MKLTILAVGKLKEAFTDAAAEFQKRLSRYVKLEILETPDEKTPEDASVLERQKILELEGNRLLKLIRADAYVIALAIEGNMLDSVELSEKSVCWGLEEQARSYL